MGSIKKSAQMPGLLKDIIRNVGKTLPADDPKTKEFVGMVDAAEGYEDMDYDGGYYDDEGSKASKQGDGVILINGKPYKPSKRR